MAQYALPDVDLANAWSEGAGDGDGDHFDELDEGFGAGRGSGSGPDDASSYWTSPSSPNHALGSELSDVTDPTSSTGHIYRGRSRKVSSGGQQIDIKITLLQGTAPKASQTFTNIDTTWTTRTSTMSGAEADSITDYGLLVFETRAVKVGGGAPRSADESAQEFECPDAGGGPTVHDISASISAIGSVAVAVGLFLQTIAATLPAIGSVSVPNLGLTSFVSATLPGVGSVAAPVSLPLQTISATLPGVAGISAPVSVIVPVSATLPGIGGVSAPVSVIVPVSATLPGIASVSVPVAVISPISAVLPGIASVSVPVSLPLQTVSATLPGIGGVSAPVTVFTPISATLPAIGGVSASVTVISSVTVHDISAALPAIATVSAPVSLPLQTVTATLPGIGGISAPVLVLKPISATLPAIGSVNASVSLPLQTVKATLPGVAGVSAPVTVLKFVSATLPGVAGVSAPVSLRLQTVKSSLSGIVSVGAPLTVLRPVSATLAGIVSVSVPALSTPPPAPVVQLAFFTYLQSSLNLAGSATVTASSEDANFPGINAVELPISRPWKSADGVTTGAKLLINLGSAQPIDAIALVNHNLRLGSVLTVRGGTVSDPDGSDFETTLAYRPKLSWALLSDAETWQYWSFQLNDSGNPANHTRAGYAMLGLSIALPRTVTPEWTLTPTRVIRRVQDEFGTAMVGGNVSEGHLLSVAFGLLTIAQRNTIRDFLDGLQLGVVPLLIVLNPSDTEAYFVRLLEGWSMVTVPPNYTRVVGLEFQTDNFGLVTT